MVSGPTAVLDDASSSPCLKRRAGRLDSSVRLALRLAAGRSASGGLAGDVGDFGLLLTGTGPLESVSVTGEPSGASLLPSGVSRSTTRPFFNHFTALPYSTLKLAFSSASSASSLRVVDDVGNDDHDRAAEQVAGKERRQRRLRSFATRRFWRCCPVLLAAVLAARGRGRGGAGPAAVSGTAAPAGHYGPGWRRSSHRVSAPPTPMAVCHARGLCHVAPLRLA